MEPGSVKMPLMPLKKELAWQLLSLMLFTIVPLKVLLVSWFKLSSLLKLKCLTVKERTLLVQSTVPLKKLFLYSGENLNLPTVSLFTRLKVTPRSSLKPGPYTTGVELQFPASTPVLSWAPTLNLHSTPSGIELTPMTRLSILLVLTTLGLAWETYTTQLECGKNTISTLRLESGLVETLTGGECACLLVLDKTIKLELCTLILGW